MEAVHDDERAGAARTRLAWLRGPYGHAAVRRACAAALAFQWIIVVSGATVRLTGSGLGCPNWPTCTTERAIPALDQHALVEFANRMMATPTLLTALVACWMAWRAAGPARPDLRIATSAVVVGVLAQAAVGAFTVILELPPSVVSVHFFLSVVLLTAATFAWRASRHAAQVGLRRTEARTTMLAGAVLLLVLLLIIVAGVVTTASGPHSGASGTGQLVERLDHFRTAVAIHARAAYAFLVLVLVVAWRRARIGVPNARALGMLAGLVVVQIALGEWQYRTGLPWGVVLAHVANACLLWAATVAFVVDALVVPRAARAVR